MAYIENMDMMGMRNRIEGYSEIASTISETKYFNPDKRINESYENMDVNNQKDKNDFNPDKRIHVSEVQEANSETDVNRNDKLDENTDIKSPSKNEVVNSERRILDRGLDLTQEQKSELLSKGMSPGIIGDCTFKDGVYQLKTSYNKFEGRELSTTGVKYARKTIDYFGAKLEGVFPKFESVFTAQLPDEKLKLSDDIQFSECVKQLQDALKDNSSLQKQFTSRQLEQIAHGKNPGGFTWHHNEEIGKMELVKSDVHAESWHTGGRAIWGGGGKAR